MSRLPPTIQADPGFNQATYQQRLAQWKDIIRQDPRRAVRVLALNGLGDETVEGDTAMDTMYIISELGSIARDAKSDVWKRLVEAGIVNALCKCALRFQAAVMHKNEKVNKRELDAVAKEMHSPYFVPLEIINNALVTRTVPPGSTERRMADEIKKHWPAITQRMWSEPSHMLEAGPKRVMERMAVSQILGQLIMIDPSLLDVIYKASDLTLTVIFRSWMYSTTAQDVHMNLSFILPLINAPQAVPTPWRDQLAQYPRPPIEVLFPRMLLGSGKVAGSDKKKRTPGQAADAIVSAIAAHLECLALKDIVYEYSLFHALFNYSKTENRAFTRALFKSEKFWAANIQVMRRALEERSMTGMTCHLGALVIFTMVLPVVAGDEREFNDALIYNWISCGLFDILEESMDFLAGVGRAPTMILGILNYFQDSLTSLSTKTRSLFRSQLPRAGLMKELYFLAAFTSEEGRRELAKHGMSSKAPENVVWPEVVWRTLAILHSRAMDPQECWRRTCTNRALDSPEATCPNCEQVKVKYCSKNCLRRDAPEHAAVCKWIAFEPKGLHESVDKAKKKSVTASPGNGAPVENTPSKENPNIVEQLGSMTLRELD